MKVCKVIVAVIVPEEEAAKVERDSSEIYNLFAGLDNGCVSNYGLAITVEPSYDLLLCISCNEPITGSRYIMSKGAVYHIRCAHINDEELLL